jgi:hypothetical protein
VWERRPVLTSYCGLGSRKRCQSSEDLETARIKLLVSRTTPVSRGRMPVYVPPVWSDPVFRDGTGAVIEYGSRWGWGGPPADTYSVDSHPERFAPLHLVADTLIEHLAQTYDVRIDRDASCADDFLHPPDFERVARLTPTDAAAASLTFGFTTYPGIFLHAGVLQDFAYPPCGCDACDESASSQVELLEFHVSAVVAGLYREGYTPGSALPVEFALGSDQIGGQSGGSSTTDGYPDDRLATAAAKLRELPQGWVAWAPRGSSC